MKLIQIIFLVSILIFSDLTAQHNQIKINEQGYYEIPGLNYMVFDDFYPEGHQGGVSIIQFGTRVAANGDVRLEPTPGQWAPVPKVGKRIVDRENNNITVELWYPDSSKNKKGFNPIDYPDITFKYYIRTETVGNSLKVIVDLEKPLPAEWDGKVGFNLELFPGHFFGEHYLMDSESGVFPRQANAPLFIGDNGMLQPSPLASGKEFTASPGNKLKQIKISSLKEKILLYDGRSLHNNGWFTLRSIFPSGQTKNVIEWIISPETNTEWRYKPVIQISQVGYHPAQNKFAVIELDKLTENFENIQLVKIEDNNDRVIKSDASPKPWGNFLRYKYLRFDFSEITDAGIYKILYGHIESNKFEIKNNIYSNDVWQPTLEYFLPVQMCHMKIFDRYKVWHGLCHMDDALMAPTNHNHFDGYIQRESTLTKYQQGEHVPGINIGGWHDAGDYDLRVESQAETIYKLALAHEYFKIESDQTSINQKTRLVEIHLPDGKPDILQQIEHGVLSIVGGYESLGRLYRGIIEPTIRQYVHLGDGATMTDNFIYKKNETDPILNLELPNDDRWVFTEKNPRRELETAKALAAAYRVLLSYDESLAQKCLSIAEELYNQNDDSPSRLKINAAGELFISTSKEKYKNVILENVDVICNSLLNHSEVIGRVTDKLADNIFRNKIEDAVEKAYAKIKIDQRENPYGVPYKPAIWGAGWNIQAFGASQLFLHLSFPEIFKSEYLFNALNFILGCHPGENTASFVSGIGVNSLTVAYGVNRDEWSYIPGGIGSGTALIRPDLPELKIWPYFWQQTEYVLGGGTTDYLLLAIAADYLLNKK